jgi:tetratricopeptide (TPR) repeat protein
MAQSQRSLNNEGVELYEKGKYSDAEVNFKKSLDENYESFEGHFNLGDALYKQGRYKEALQEFQNALSFAETENQKAKIFYNIGNTLLKSGKIKESIGAYANSLKLNPKDLQSKYNLSYALKLLKNQKQKNKQKSNRNKNRKNKQKQNQNSSKQQKNKKRQNSPCRLKTNPQKPKAF